MNGPQNMLMHYRMVWTNLETSSGTNWKLISDNFNLREGNTSYFKKIIGSPGNFSKEVAYIGHFDWCRNIIILIQKYTKLPWLKQSFSYLGCKPIIGFFVPFFVGGYWAKSGSPSCLICFFFRLKAQKQCYFFSLQHFRAKEFEEVQDRAFWKILWRGWSETFSHINKRTQEEAKNGPWGCLYSSSLKFSDSIFLFPWPLLPQVFWLYLSLPVTSVTSPAQSPSPEFCLNLDRYVQLLSHAGCCDPNPLTTPWGLRSSLPPRYPKKCFTCSQWQLFIEIYTDGKWSLFKGIQSKEIGSILWTTVAK